MADKRKLQAEIERCIKKVQEGVELFDEIWEKVQEANNTNQKEKFEADLKKEIKKLQRLRDQIKGWQNSNEIKDKSQLQENRKLIEQKMEQFKVVERETKTKAYSKQGLGAEQKLDPKEKEKEESILWLQDCIDRLNQQNDVFESEIEQFTAIGGKKKKLDKDKQDKLDSLRKHVERHKFHIQKLELLMRLLTNNSIEAVQVKKIKDDLEHYIENNQETDFEENEYMYDDLELGEMEQLGNLTSVGSVDDAENSETNTTASMSPSSSPVPSQASSKTGDRDNEDAVTKTRHASGDAEYVAKPVASRAISSTTRSTPTTPMKFTNQASTESGVSTSPLTATPPPLPGIPYNSVAAGNRSGSASKAVIINRTLPDSATSSNSAQIKPNHENASLAVGSGSGINQIDTNSTSASPTATQQGSAGHSSQQSGAALSHAQNQSNQSVLQGFSTPMPASNQSASNKQSTTAIVNGPADSQAEEAASVLSLKSLAEQAASSVSSSDCSNSALTTTAHSDITSSVSAQNCSSQQPANVLTSSAGQAFLMSLASLCTSQVSQEAKIPPALGASPLGKSPLVGEHIYQLSMLDYATHHLPFPSDSERLRNYLPRSPCQTPSYYPQVPPPMADTLEYFNRLTPETLFFIFYYMEGTKAQYLAAKALKRQSWRFHTKYMMWFQRHEEPKTITEEYEQGTYIYFDFEKWAQRKKEGFTFEYRFLEDRELS